MTDDENKEKYSDATQKNAFSIFLTLAIFLILFFAIWDTITQRYNSWPTWSYALCSTTLTSVLLWIVFAAKKSINPQTLSLYIKKHLNRLPLFAAICLWATAATILYTALNWMWGKSGVLSGWTLNGETSGPLERIKSSLVIIGGIGGVGYLVIKYREQSGAERDRARLEENEADKKLADAVQQLGSESPQVRIAGCYALADVADTYGSENYTINYNKRTVDILCGYLRANQPANANTHRYEGKEIYHAAPVVESTILFIVAKLARISWAYESTTESPQSLSVDLRSTKLTNAMSFHGAQIKEINCSECNLKNIVIAHTIFEHAVNFQRSTFEESVNFTNTKFCPKPALSSNSEHNQASIREVIFRRAVFIQGVSFRCSEFGENANFTNASFQRSTDFHVDDEVIHTLELGIAVNFQRTIFWGGAKFCGAKFGGESDDPTQDIDEKFINFDRVEFHETTSFFNATFACVANFGSYDNKKGEKPATFHGEVDFSWTTFTGDALFHGAFELDTGVQFNGEAKFQNTKFERNVRFGSGYSLPDYRTTFLSDVDFRGAKFGDKSNVRYFANFSGVEFNGIARFGSDTPGFYAQFFGVAEFRYSIFKSNTDFKGVKFNGSTYFNGSRFKEKVDFSGAEFKGKADFRGAEFEKGAEFKNARFNVKYKGEGGYKFPKDLLSNNQELPEGASWFDFTTSIKNSDEDCGRLRNKIETLSTHKPEHKPRWWRKLGRPTRRKFYR